jgi:soluble lytic murein transglycosylase-like protein
VSIHTDKSVIPLFDRTQHHSSVPTIFVTAVARSGGPGRSRGRRDSASPLTAASTMARLRSLGATMCIVVIVASFALWGNTVSAKRLSSPAHRAGAALLAPFAAFVTEASLRFGVPEHWIRAVMRVESAGDIRARSRKGAMGLTQIMPETWTELRARYNLGTDPYDPHDNILAGAAYLREMHDRYGAPGFLAAYNAGPGRYERHLATGRPLPDETQAYVATLAPMIGGRQVERKVAAADSSNWQRATLFVVRGENRSIDDRRSPDMQSRRPLGVHAVIDLSALVPQPHNLFVRRAGEVRSQ